MDDGPAGTYTVSFRVLSDDGHVIPGSFVYHVERRSEERLPTVAAGEGVAAEIVGALGRWIAFTGALLLGGVLAMAVVVDRGEGRRWTGGLAAVAGCSSRERWPP